MRNTLREYTITVAPGVTDYLSVVGNGVQLRAGSVPLRVRNPRLDLDLILSSGDGIDNLDEFTELQLSHDSGAAQSFTMAVSVGAASSRSAVVAGLPEEQGAYLQSTKTVTNASGLLVSANSGRRVLLVSNQSATGNIYLNLAGSAATVAGGVKIAAGGVLLLDRYPPSGDVYAIGDIASNAAVIVAEG